MAVWDDSSTNWPAPPEWSLTGHMLLWNDGSPAHVQMEPFQKSGQGWEAQLTIARSTRDGTRWLPLTMTLSPDVLRHWESQGTSARLRALQALANYVRLTEWYQDDLGVLELK